MTNQGGAGKQKNGGKRARGGSLEQDNTRGESFNVKQEITHWSPKIIINTGQARNNNK